MIFLVDNINIQGTEYDHRRKLTNDQIDEIKKLGPGFGLRALARKFEVSPTLIQYILYPERMLKNIEIKDNKKYFNREKRNKAVKELRRRKKLLIKKGLIKPKEEK